MATDSPSYWFIEKKLIVVLILLYAAGASYGAWKTIIHAEGSTTAIEKILSTYNMKNEGTQALNRFSQEHPFLGLFASPVKKELNLPSEAGADEALHSEVPHQLKIVRSESSAAAWWSWLLLSASLLYVVVVIVLERSFTSRAVLFVLTSVSVVCFFIGILAPALVIWTAPDIPLESGDLNFVVQHQVRGIAAIIKDLFVAGHWIIGGFLFLFSILTPLTKATLTFFVTACRSRELNLKVGEFLHTIGKWSMADVFVAAILLALYALKFQEATKSFPCLGLYYFIGYCLLSMTTTELLVHSEEAAGVKPGKSRRKMGLMLIAGLFVGVFCLISASSVYTYEQYTVNIKQSVKAPSSPGQLNDSHLVLPVHK